MKTIYATKRDINGNTYKLIVDTEKRQFAHENSGFFHRSDAVTVSKRAIREIKSQVVADGYTETDAL